jgi:hypothetical protein
MLQGNINWRERLTTVDLLIEVACFVTKVNNIFNIKRADINYWPFQIGFSTYLTYTRCQQLANTFSFVTDRLSELECSSQTGFSSLVRLGAYPQSSSFTWKIAKDKHSSLLTVVPNKLQSWSLRACLVFAEVSPQSRGTQGATVG